MKTPMITVKEAAKLLGITPNTAYTQIRENRFPVPVKKVGESIRISRADLEEWMGASRHEVVTPAPTSDDGLPTCRTDKAYVSIIPAPAVWWVRYTNRAGVRTKAPLIGWGVTQSGEIVTLTYAGGQEILDIRRLTGAKVFRTDV